ncbi:MAG: Gfo/Idh/MocA family oxidoreductase [Chloroflexi bacterium]|nr:Gfo/Idh/MocA family oxidoreductase [Chloroflexota bacterium]MBV9895027.1 Gfo/Idh/MocA family oxidoreductase [Chloroflexota bacterium]
MTVRVAVVGLGTMGRHHVRVLDEMEPVELVGVADANAQALARATQRRDYHGYTSLAELLEREQPELVVIAVPTSLHCEAAVMAMQAGAHVLVEKPIASSIPEARQIVAASKRYKRRIAVGHIERFNPAVVALKQRLDQEELGRVFRLNARRIGPFPVRIRDVGVVIDLATHDIDIARYLLASEPTRIYAETAQRIHTDHEDMLAALLRFEDGVVAQLDVNWLTPTKVREVSVTGERGMFQVNYLTQELVLYENNDADLANMDPISGVTEGRMLRFRIEPKEPLRAELENVVHSVAADCEPLVGPTAAFAALEIAETIVKAARAGTVVQMRHKLAATA